MNEILRFAQDDTKDVILRREAPKNLQIGLLRRCVERCLAMTMQCVFICSLISGCASAQFEQLKKKFIRQKKEKLQPIRFLEEPVRRKNSEYYEEHILYFKTWNDTLIEFLGSNRKREVQAVREAQRHLAALPKYLEPEYADKLQAIVTDYEELTAPLRMNSLPESRNSSVSRELGRLQIRVQRDFSFKEIKDHLLPDPTNIDLSAYEDDETEEPVSQIDSEGSTDEPNQEVK